VAVAVAVVVAVVVQQANTFTPKHEQKGTSTPNKSPRMFLYIIRLNKDTIENHRASWEGAHCFYGKV